MRSSGAQERLCEGPDGIVCPIAQGRRCGVEMYLDGLSSQIRGAVRSKLEQSGQAHPDRIVRLCAESLHGGKLIVGVMGPGEGASPQDEEHAFALGQLIAKEDWVLLTGGRPAGVMAAANKGAKSAGGLTVGILPTRTTTPENTSADVDIRIVTGMHDARNAINVLSSDVVIACGTGSGTASEITLAIKAGKPVILLTSDKEAIAFFRKLGKGQVSVVQTPEEAVAKSEALLTEQIRRGNSMKG